jgi:hypothetical protein
MDDLSELGPTPGSDPILWATRPVTAGQETANWHIYLVDQQLSEIGVINYLNANKLQKRTRPTKHNKYRLFSLLTNKPGLEKHLDDLLSYMPYARAGESFPVAPSLYILVQASIQIRSLLYWICSFVACTSNPSIFSSR